MLNRQLTISSYTEVKARSKLDKDHNDKIKQILNHYWFIHAFTAPFASKVLIAPLFCPKKSQYLPDITF